MAGSGWAAMMGRLAGRRDLRWGLWRWRSNDRGRWEGGSSGESGRIGLHRRHWLKNWSTRSCGLRQARRYELRPLLGKKRFKLWSYCGESICSRCRNKLSCCNI